MIVRPELISANSAPKAKPLKSCETKLGHVIMERLSCEGVHFEPVRESAHPSCWRVLPTLTRHQHPWERTIASRRAQARRGRRPLPPASRESSQVYEPRWHPKASGFCMRPSPGTI